MDGQNKPGWRRSETLPGGITQILAEYAIPASTATKILKGARSGRN